MEVIRIGAISPPDTQRSQWARNGVAEALERKLSPVAVPMQSVVSFTATMAPALVVQLKELAQSSGIPISRITAGLLEALRLESETVNPKVVDCGEVARFPGRSEVRAELLPLLEQSAEGVENGKIVFAEAATGTGKGWMIAALAANAAAKGDTVVISAPLAVTWQLLDSLGAISEAQAAGITMSLGRPNFVSPTRLLEWAAENEHASLVEWIEGGGSPLGARTIGASAIIDHQLCWMLEDALSLADDLPVDAIMLTADDGDDCPAQQLYKAMRSNHTKAGIILCSHYMLAAHVRFLQMRGGVGEDGQGDDAVSSYSLPTFIDTLIVDEAHQLEQAFAAIYSHTLRLRPLIRVVEKHAKRGKTPVIAALNSLAQQITKTVQKSKGGRNLVCSLDDAPELEAHLKDCLTALDSVKSKSLDGAAKATINVANRAMKHALAAGSRLRMEITPVKNYPMMVSGRANLQKALMCLWDSVSGAVLVSATLYATDGQAALTRWKLEVPPARAHYLAPVHPGWTTAPVKLHSTRNTIEPDDSSQWADECAGLIDGITAAAKGGTLILCTSFQNVDMLHELLLPILGDRLIWQSKSASASMCATQYRALYHEGKRPVWLGLGAAWTGIDLSDAQAAPADDTMLTDLVITRLPVGLNRSLTHERRIDIAGYKIVTLEGVWQLRQGLGRLVRRPGVINKNLWVLDSRLDSKAPWVTPYKRTLSKFV